MNFLNITSICKTGPTDDSAKETEGEESQDKDLHRVS